MTPAYSAHFADSNAAIAATAWLQPHKLQSSDTRPFGAKNGMLGGGTVTRAYHKVPVLWRVEDLLGTVETLAPTLPEVPLPALQRLVKAASIFSDAELNKAAYAEAVKLLDIIQAAKIENVPLPDIGVGEDEISFSWSKDGRIALLSVEGDGEAAYTYHVDAKFRPGQEVFMVSDEKLPVDLREYLRDMYA